MELSTLQTEWQINDQQFIFAAIAMMDADSHTFTMLWHHTHDCYTGTLTPSM